jgi:hypothetical protein
MKAPEKPVETMPPPEEGSVATATGDLEGRGRRCGIEAGNVRLPSHGVNTLTTAQPIDHCFALVSPLHRPISRWPRIDENGRKSPSKPPL